MIIIQIYIYLCNPADHTEWFGTLISILVFLFGFDQAEITSPKWNFLARFIPQSLLPYDHIIDLYA